MICSILSNASCKTVFKEIIFGYLGRADANAATNIDQTSCADPMVASTSRDIDQQQLAKQRLAEHVEILINVQDNFHSKYLLTFQLFAVDLYRTS